MLFKMIKYIFLYFAILLYVQKQCASEIYVPDVDEIKAELNHIIERENHNIELLEKNLKQFTGYYLENIKDIEFDGDLVRQSEIIDDTLTNIKLKLHYVAHINDSAECYSDALYDLDGMYEKFLNDTEQCKNNAHATYDRLIRDFLAFKKATKRIIKRVQKILKICQFGDEESWNCKRQDVPIKDLSVLANHTYQYETQNVHRADQILQDFRDCNALAVKPPAELALHFVDTLDDECDYYNVSAI